MKIRIKGNSVRFRLTKKEVDSVCEKGIFREKTQFNEAHFVYAVTTSDKHDNLYASFLNQGIILFVPTDLVRDWDASDQVGFYHTQILDDGQELDLTLEKDFVCLDDRDEDESDNYPNPRADENVNS
ncbi:hypothetical protein RQM65_15570 [Pricia sp. S334]|uniref:Uncharacterized protein n=1 Tax=Pricia mediterranea TaxID=3076079 RepID=A0ABU3L9V5_9FLAO|nr:hypothetical protein [Pricia sp. S334]MDT7830086.1 hypothetical protein [Pricia sp. S334]